MERLVVILILHILQFHFIDGENDEKVKRLLLNDPDVVGQISRMQNHINSLTQLVSQLTSKLNTVESELAAQKLKTTGTGSTYVRWGKSTCAGDHTELVYSGYAAGQRYVHSSYATRFGGPSNRLCMPHDPEPSNITTRAASLLYGSEYEENILAPDAANEDVPCAVCRSTTTQTSIMIPGRETCYSGWKKEYNGLIASGHLGETASSYVCLDKKIEYTPSGKTNDNGALFYMTSMVCGSLSCPPYYENKAVNCVVCSK